MTGLAPGTEFAGHLIDTVAGRGGMGVVYRATQVALERVVALKLIVPELADDPGLRERFERESRIAASIDHPNVLPLYYAGEHDGVLYQAMRYVDGTDLRTMIRANGPLPPERAIPIITQVAAALDAAHARGLVHRDVKPANVMLGVGDHAYLSDFGLTRRTKSQDAWTHGGSVVGTFDYVSPEQIRGARVDARADVYSLGGLLFTALSGQVPFPRENDEARLWAHMHAAPPKLSMRSPGLPPALDPVIERALAKRPEDRYPSAGDLARAARAALEGSPVSQPERLVAAGDAAPLDGSTVSATLPSGVRRRSRRRVLMLASMAIVGVAATTALTFTRPAADERTAPPTPRPSRTPGPAAAPSSPAPRPAIRLTGMALAGRRPSMIGLAGHSVWVATFSDGLVRMRETATNRRATVFRGRGVAAVASGHGAVWVAFGPLKMLQRLDPRNGRAAGPVVTLPHRSRSLAVGSGAVWSAGRAPSTLVRIDSRAGHITDVLPVRVRALAAHGDSVWALGEGRRELYEFSGSPARLVRRIDTGTDPNGVAVGAGAVWVTNAGDDTVMRLDLRTQRRTFIHVPDGPAKIAVRGNSVWVTCLEDDRLARIDVRTRRLVRPTLRLHGDPFALAVDSRFVWVTLLSRDRVARVEYRRS
jgi:serine/threonine protein kinase